MRVALDLLFNECGNGKRPQSRAEILGTGPTLAPRSASRFGASLRLRSTASSRARSRSEPLRARPANLGGQTAVQLSPLRTPELSLSHNARH
jgi:hypothetical protein